MAKLDSFQEVPSDRVVLVLRCAGRKGKCRNLQAILLENGTVHYTEVDCHRLPDNVELHTEVSRAYERARVEWARARRARRPFQPREIAISPAPRHAREDRYTREAREQFDAWLNWHDPD